MKRESLSAISLLAGVILAVGLLSFGVFSFADSQSRPQSGAIPARDTAPLRLHVEVLPDAHVRIDSEVLSPLELQEKVGRLVKVYPRLTVFLRRGWGASEGDLATVELFCLDAGAWNIVSSKAPPK